MIPQTPTKKIIKLPSRGLTYPTLGKGKSSIFKMPFFGDMLVSWRVNKLFNFQCYFQTYPVLVMCQPLEGGAETTLQVLYQMPWRLGECWYFGHDTSSTLAIVIKRWVEDLKMGKKHYMIGMHMYTSVCFPALDSVGSNVQDIN